MSPEIRTGGIFGTHSSLGPFEPEALLSRPERVHKTLFQALHGFTSRLYWETTSWKNYPRPRDHSALSIRRRVPYNSLGVPSASSFLCAHPALTSRVSSRMWSCMLRRHLDTPVFSDSIRPLICTHCRRPMDPRGDHAAICAHGFGVVNRHNTVRNLLARHAFRAAGLSCNLEVPFILPGSDARPADILVQPTAPPAGAPPDRPIAYDVTVISVYRGGTLSRAAQELAGAAEAAHVCSALTSLY